MNVVILKDKLDALANAIGIKAGKRVPQTIDELVETVEGIETGGGTPNLQAKTRTITAAGTFTDTPDEGYDGLSSVQTTVEAATLENSESSGAYSTSGGRRIWQPVMYAYFSGGFIDSGETTIRGDIYNAVASGTSVSPTESAQAIGGANTMMEGAVTVNAISSSYVGSGVTRRSSSDLTASGDTVSVPAGYYASSASKSVEGIPDGDELEYGSAGLAGTTWYFDTTPTLPSSDVTYSVNFTSNSASWASMELSSFGGIVYRNGGDIANAYASFFGGWQNAAYRTVTFTGGTDASNAELIAWVEANATQQ